MKKIAFFVLIAGIIGGAAMAQEYQEGIPWGNAYFKPSVEFIYTHSDNIFRTDPSVGEQFDDNIWMIRPQLALEFPFENSYINVQVQYEYKDYEEYELLHHNTWFGVLDSQFKFSNGSVLSVRDHYIQGCQQVELFDPDMEVYWNTSRFSKNNAEVQYDIPLNSLNTLVVHIGHDYVNFKSDQDSGRIPFYSFSQKSGGLKWKYLYQPLAGIFVEYEHVSSSPKDDNYLYTALEYWTTEKNYREDRISFGWEGNAQRRLSGIAKIGYKKMRFNDNYYQDHFDVDFDDYKGVVADLGLKYKLANFTDLSANLFRRASQSAFNVNNYYTATGGDLRLHHQFSKHFFGTLGAKYQKNHYPEGVVPDVNGDGWVDPGLASSLAGQRRNDEISQFLLEAGYHFTPRISMRFNYLYEDRDSNLAYSDYYNIERKPYSYNENRFVFQIQMGW